MRWQKPSRLRRLPRSHDLWRQSQSQSREKHSRRKMRRAVKPNATFQAKNVTPAPARWLRPANEQSMNQCPRRLPLDLNQYGSLMRRRALKSQSLRQP